MVATKVKDSKPVGRSRVKRPIQEMPSVELSPPEIATYIGDVLTGLAILASRKDMMFLAYLIEMAQIEAHNEAARLDGK